ncbi:unnamed protein product [Medioppia subpectinata]|uniref:Uncharacterized protein n=1 Tax=Medioppia subpectinata TaxID=1979941 RepID=A0A7R9LWA0_9ACAR|nr:unnamed protein product [Medioppia subpectinata]CAG2122285.1 unnamed protein product [Medioppia subpectinata]
MRSLLESQRNKHEDNSDTTFLIDELLPQLSANTDQFRRSATESGVSVSRDLSTILKNLKKLEQSFDVLNQVLDPSLSTTQSTATRRHPNAFFVVDV